MPPAPLSGTLVMAVYGLVRHPMYLLLIIYGLGQAIAVSNWLAAPPAFV
jgi:protein-S-isoprenylcysteine O-methyltransferase Ste14